MKASATQTVIAVDFGTRRIGIAVGSMVTGTSSAITTLLARSGEPDWPELDKIIREWQPEVIVVGMPYNMDGSESEMTALVREFAEVLIERYHLPVDTADERLTSAEASSILKEQRRLGLRQKKVEKTDIDSLAACLIAESWMQSEKTKQ
jgi:putative Holliday junction resolvase